MRREPTAEQKAAAKLRREKMGKLAHQIEKMSEDERAALTERIGVVTIEGRSLSIHNQCMLALQSPAASVVGGFQQWRRSGRMVQKGQHGACIWIPLGIPKRAEGETESETADPIGFTLATVFDVTQTEPMEAKAAELTAVAT